jgi:hypothetical protein
MQMAMRFDKKSEAVCDIITQNIHISVLPYIGSAIALSFRCAFLWVSAAQ